MGSRELREMVKKLISMNVKQLKALAKENGYKGYSKLKKAELVDIAYDILIVPLEGDLKAENIVEVEILEPNTNLCETVIEHYNYDINKKKLTEEEIVADIAKKVGYSVSGKGLAYAFTGRKFNLDEKELLEMLNNATEGKVRGTESELKKIDEFIEEHEKSEEANKIFIENDLAYRINFSMYVIDNKIYYQKLLVSNNGVRESHRNFLIICPSLNIMPPNNKDYDWLYNDIETLEEMQQNNLICFLDEYSEDLVLDIAEPIQYGFNSKYADKTAIEILLEESKTRKWECSMSDCIDLKESNGTYITMSLDQLMAINNGELYYINMEQLLQYKEVCLDNVELVKEVIDTNMKQLTTAINQKYLA